MSETESTPLSSSHNASRKRNTLPSWTQKVRVTPGLGVEGPPRDGYRWRKYGLKNIPGSPYPRVYYRCTYGAGCLARKQVQRSDEDPTVFEITYRGEHTCTISSSNVVAPDNQESNIVNTDTQQQNNTDTPLHETETVIPIRIHEVFLSFRGEDTRASFTSHLHSSLQNNGINVFIDDCSLERGDFISDSLMQAIEGSKISVVVFSRNYPDSKWCLEELEKIMECHRTREQVVLPVFYGVDPLEVCHQTGEFGKAFQNLLDRFPTSELELGSGSGNSLRENFEPRWSMALRQAASLEGFVVVNGNESEDIKDIVEDVTRLLDKTDLLIANNPPLSSSPYPCGEDSVRDFEDHDHNASRKRNTLPSWTATIRVTPGMGVEGPLDEGYSWRKYGQKDILGAKHPREYHRCAHRNVQGCLATKQVQRSNEDPTVCEITYRGKHTCTNPQPQNNTDTPLHETERMIPARIHDVFLSFRGEDTRVSFTSHLHASLKNEGINVFRDDDSLRRGDLVSPSLLKAIEDSQISVVVFSTNYADSRWCLDELEKIMECHRTIGQVVLPVFYNVDPSKVRHQTGEFGKAFQNLLDRFPKLELELGRGSRNSLRENFELRWSTALRQAASLAGFVVVNSRNESEAIKDIVANVTRLLDKTDLSIANNPVGVDIRVRDMIQLLDQDIQQSNDVLLLGMWGMGGVGKTTIAKAVYNKIGCNFEGRSFLENIREIWEQNGGQVHLQERLLFDICKETTTKIHGIESGKTKLKDRLCHKRVLLVLDDVDSLDQLNALCGSRQWFGSGSQIIITTRDMNILRGNRVDQVYKMKKMDESESVELFSWHAFRQASPREDFDGISRKVVEYSGGLPLALEVLGSYLFDRGVTEWECVLERLKRIPDDQVQKKLKISYDGLNNATEKEIFLDIACFFIGKDRNDVMHILNGCELYADIGISVLVERSLVTVDNKNRLRMHHLVRDMGREIIREESPKEPEERSRLWFNKDVLDVLSEQTGTKAIEGVALKLPRTNAERFSTEAFKKMKRLRLLQLAGVQLEGDFEYLSRNLRWLSWNGFPLTCIPTNFHQGNLVSIELANSNMKLVWRETQRMEKLKILNLSHSHYLTQTPDFSNLPSLEKLVIKDCPRLSEVSDSIGHLNKVLLINLEDCKGLRSLPRSFYKLKSLKTLILSGCLMIDELKEDLEQMESLTTLIANNTAITRVPFSVVRSKSIGYISLCGYEGFSRDVFPSIIRSWMSPTNNPSSLFQSSSAMSSLVSSDVANSSSQELSSILKHLPSLRSLWVDCGSRYQLSWDAVIILDALCATNSKQFESTATASQESNMKTSALVQCCSQMHISGSKTSMKSLLIQMGMNCQVTNMLKENILQNMDVNGCGGCLLPGDSYPDWLTFNCNGSYVSFEVPQVEGRNLKTILCIVYSSSPDNTILDGLKNILVKNYTKATIQLYKSEALASFEDEEGQRVVSSIEPGNEVEVEVVFGNGFIIEKTSVYLVYGVPIGENMEQFHAPDKNAIVCSGDGNESTVKRISHQVDPTDDVKPNKKKKICVE